MSEPELQRLCKFSYSRRRSGDIIGFIFQQNLGCVFVPQKLRLLCIDDEEIGLRIRKAVFERAGYEVLTAQNAQTSIELFKTGAFDGVVLDFLMPDVNGGEIAAALRSIRPEVPILLLSAYINLPPDVLQLVDAQVLKGAGPEELLNRVKAMIEKSQPVQD